MMRQIKRKSECASRTRHVRAAGVQLLMGAMAVGLIGTFSNSVQAQERFETDSIQFAEDTTVEFEFKSSKGAHQSTFGVVNLDRCQGQTIDTCERVPLFEEARPFDRDRVVRINDIRGSGAANNRVNDFLGTPGVTVLQPRSEYTFKANTRYAFYLASVYVHEVEVINPNTKRVERVEVQRRVDPVIYSRSASLFSKGLNGLGGGADQQNNSVGVRINWDDTGIIGKDSDSNDFVLEAGGYLVTVPCLPVK